MIKSMTGFGRYELTNEIGKISVEMKAVNHRYLDLNIKMPKAFNCFESAIRNQLKMSIQRGKVDVFIMFEDFREGNVAIHYNNELAKEYLKYMNQMEAELGLDNDCRVSTIMRLPEVFIMEHLSEKDEELLWNMLSETLAKATERFVESRILEGESLKKDMLEKLDDMLSLVDRIEEYSPSIVEAYRERLTAKVQELLGSHSVDEGRILTEVTIFADRICTDEETVRLRNHFNQAKKEFEKGESIGRKMDFLAQEMNREANTILSKSNDIQVSEIAVSLKTEIEKVREQIQNIE